MFLFKKNPRSTSKIQYNYFFLHIRVLIKQGEVMHSDRFYQIETNENSH